MKELVILTQQDDEHAGKVVSLLPSGIVVHLLTIEHLINQGYTIKIKEDGWLDLECDGKSFSQDKACDYAVWLRKPNYSFFYSSSYQFYENEYLIEETNAFLLNLFALFKGASWLNKPEAIADSKQRLLQLQIARKIGLNVPAFVVTNQTDVANALLNESQQGLIIKRLGNTKVNIPDDLGVFTSNLSREEIGHPLFKRGLNYLQERLLFQTELRITIVGDDIFPCSFKRDIESKQAIDYRNQINVTDHQVHHLPANIQHKILKLTKYFGLHYNTVDMLLDDSGNYYFLEMNPNGEWLWIENLIGLEISKAIANSLLLLTGSAKTTVIA